MCYLGFVPGERSNGVTVRSGGISKAGSGRVRWMLVESACTYRYPANFEEEAIRLEQASPRVREIA